jgi:hypothetical protein
MSTYRELHDKTGRARVKEEPSRIGSRCAAVVNKSCIAVKEEPR